MAMTTVNSLPPQVLNTLSAKLLAIKVPYLIHNLAATEKYLKEKGGLYYTQSRYDRLPVSEVPLSTDGVTPPSLSVKRVDIQTRLNWYSAWVPVNEQVLMANQDMVLNEITELLGVNLRMTEDAVTRSCLMSSASFINSTGGTNGDNPTNLTATDVQTAITELAYQDAWSILSHIEGEDRFGKMCAEVKF